MLPVRGKESGPSYRSCCTAVRPCRDAIEILPPAFYPRGNSVRAK